MHSCRSRRPPVALETQSPGEFTPILDEHLSVLQPTTPDQRACVEEMAAARCRQIRVASIENRMWNQAAVDHPTLVDSWLALCDTPGFLSLDRYAAACHRSYHRALDRLLSLRRDIKNNCTNEATLSFPNPQPAPGLSTDGTPVPRRNALVNGTLDREQGPAVSGLEYPGAMVPSRRHFIRSAATGIGTLAASRVLGANDRVRLGIIGIGDRGTQITREAIACPNTDFVAFADIYTRRLEDAKKLAPNAKTYLDYRHLLEDKSIDAVLIATPQHLHCECFVAAMQAGKHVYQEKTMAFSLDHAKRMRAAYVAAGNRTVQIGHQWCSSGQVTDAVSFLKTGNVGKITAIHAHMYRNTPHGKPQWSRPVYPDMTPENIIWKSFQGESAPHDFDANRYINWRFFWDYSGGNVYENMCHQVAFWYKVMNLQIPKAVSMTGGLYLWKDGREVPDTMNVSMEQPEEMLFTWDSGFGNNALGVTEDVLGDDGTISKGQQIRYSPQKVNKRDGVEVVGQTPTDPRGHMQNFLDCIRSGNPTNCPLEVGFRVAVACRMAVDSYRQQRTLRWDAVKEEIV
jgi:predicted dehydrogenase